MEATEQQQEASGKIATMEELQSTLETLGYTCSRADLDGDGTPEPLMTVIMSVDDKPYSTVISIEEGPDGGYFLVDCEFCQLKDFGFLDDETDNQKLTAQLLTVLALNHEIAPFAFALVDSGLDGIDPEDPIVLVHRLPIGDLSEGEVNQAFAALRRGVNAATAII